LPVVEADFLAETRAAYDTVAADYANAYDTELARLPLDRALLRAFAEYCQPGPVADMGCGPGHITANLHGLGLDGFGIDLSPEMIAQARKAHPGLRFEVGSMTALELADGSLGGLLAFYSIIFVPPQRLPGVFAEFHRVLAPGAPLLLAFQAGDERRHLTEWFGHAISLHGYRLLPGQIAETLRSNGFAMLAEVLRQPVGPDEKVPRAYLLARRDNG
jgi:SAM-dependent methyltransferase